MPGLELDAVDTNRISFPRAGILPEMGEPDKLGDLSGSERDGVECMIGTT